MIDASLELPEGAKVLHFQISIAKIVLFIHAYIFVVWVSGSTETCTFPVEAVVPSVYVTSTFGSADGEADGTGVEATDDSEITVDEA